MLVFIKKNYLNFGEKNAPKIYTFQIYAFNLKS